MIEWLSQVFIEQTRTLIVFKKKRIKRICDECEDRPETNTMTVISVSLKETSGKFLFFFAFDDL